jgi:hypothetical protein
MNYPRAKLRGIFIIKQSIIIKFIIKHLLSSYNSDTGIQAFIPNNAFTIMQVKNYKLQITNYKIILPLMLMLLMAFCCQKVDKPVRGEEGSGPMAIVIDGDAPESHTENTTSEGKKLVNPYSKIPVIGAVFKSGLIGLDFWKANHPNLVTGTHIPALKDDPEEICLDCHDQSTSCNNCHSYVGVKLITGGK